MLRPAVLYYFVVFLHTLLMNQLDDPFQVVRCLRLLKKFDPVEFQSKSTTQDYKIGEKRQATDQVMELPLENCIYDMIKAEGSKGITLVEVLL